MIVLLNSALGSERALVGAHEHNSPAEPQTVPAPAPLLLGHESGNVATGGTVRAAGGLRW